jgi:hypothetical protein
MKTNSWLDLRTESMYRPKGFVRMSPPTRNSIYAVFTRTSMPLVPSSNRVACKLCMHHEIKETHLLQMRWKVLLPPILQLELDLGIT